MIGLFTNFPEMVYLSLAIIGHHTNGNSNNFDDISKKLHQNTEFTSDFTSASPGTRSTSSKVTPTDNLDEVKIHLSKSEEELFDINLVKFIEKYLKPDTETRTVTLNNKWRVTDSIGNPDFPQLLEDDPNFDLLTFITERLPF